MSAHKNDNEIVYCPSSLQPHTMPRRNSLRLLTTTPNIPVPPSLRTSPYLTSPIFSRSGFASSPTIPSEEDERWLQDTIPLSSRHHLQVAGESGSTDRKGSEIHVSRRAVTGQMQKGVVHSLPPLHQRRHISVGHDNLRVRSGLGITIPNDPRASNFVPPSLAHVLDPNWTNLGWRSAGLCRRRWSTGPLRPPNPDKTFAMSGN